MDTGNSTPGGALPERPDEILNRAVVGLLDFRRKHARGQFAACEVILEALAAHSLPRTRRIRAIAL